MGKVYFRCFERMENCKVTAIVSGSLDKKDAEEMGVALYAGLEEMLCDQQLDAVCICTPTEMHYSQVESVLEHGVNVICEKPLTLHSADAERLYGMAEEKKLLLLPAHVVQFCSSTKWLRDVVASNKYGRVREASFYRFSTRPHWCKGNWAYDKARSGLVPYDLHIHDLDLILSLFGNPKKSCVKTAAGADSPIPEYYKFTYDYDDFSVTAEASWYMADIPFRSGWRILFDEALAMQENDIIKVYQNDGNIYRVEPKQEEQHNTGFSVPATDMYDVELQCFAECIRNGKKPAELPEQQVIQALEILEDLSSVC